ncbi:hypothetical protein OH799_06475 [Nocardia sp. NBC_00881]|uniref:hypothetical protein n=1 Tax=Nocardia sp. NBC_00881 TaxID=2975995 RepID=UPI003863BC0C|nr:hypothetical protein OH799_06475 [Nocardia sp. NBC_00881]
MPDSVAPRIVLCRIRVVYDGLVLQFRSTLEQAANFAEAMSRHPAHLVVLVDDRVHPDLPWLPCRRLWD